MAGCGSYTETQTADQEVGSWDRIEAINTLITQMGYGFADIIRAGYTQEEFIRWGQRYTPPEDYRPPEAGSAAQHLNDQYFLSTQLQLPSRAPQDQPHYDEGQQQQAFGQGQQISQSYSQSQLQSSQTYQHFAPPQLPPQSYSPQVGPGFGHSSYPHNQQSSIQKQQQWGSISEYQSPQSQIPSGQGQPPPQLQPPLQARRGQQQPQPQPQPQFQPHFARGQLPHQVPTQTRFDRGQQFPQSQSQSGRGQGFGRGQQFGLGEQQAQTQFGRGYHPPQPQQQIPPRQAPQYQGVVYDDDPQGLYAEDAEPHEDGRFTTEPSREQQSSSEDKEDEASDVEDELLFPGINYRGQTEMGQISRDVPQPDPGPNASPWGIPQLGYQPPPYRSPEMHRRTEGYRFAIQHNMDPRTSARGNRVLRGPPRNEVRFGTRANTSTPASSEVGDGRRRRYIPRDDAPYMGTFNEHPEWHGTGIDDRPRKKGETVRRAKEKTKGKKKANENEDDDGREDGKDDGGDQNVGSSEEKGGEVLQFDIDMIAYRKSYPKREARRCHRCSKHRMKCTFESKPFPCDPCREAGVKCIRVPPIGQGSTVPSLIDARAKKPRAPFLPSRQDRQDAQAQWRRPPSPFKPSPRRVSTSGLENDSRKSSIAASPLASESRQPTSTHPLGPGYPPVPATQANPTRPVDKGMIGTPGRAQGRIQGHRDTRFGPMRPCRRCTSLNLDLLGCGLLRPCFNCMYNGVALLCSSSIQDQPFEEHRMEGSNNDGYQNPVSTSHQNSSAVQNIIESAGSFASTLPPNAGFSALGPQPRVSDLVSPSPGPSSAGNSGLGLSNTMKQRPSIGDYGLEQSNTMQQPPSVSGFGHSNTMQQTPSEGFSALGRFNTIRQPSSEGHYGLGQSNTMQQPHSEGFPGLDQSNIMQQPPSMGPSGMPGPLNIGFATTRQSPSMQDPYGLGSLSMGGLSSPRQTNNMGQDLNLTPSITTCNLGDLQYGSMQTPLRPQDQGIFDQGQGSLGGFASQPPSQVPRAPKRPVDDVDGDETDPDAEARHKARRIEGTTSAQEAANMADALAASQTNQYDPAEQGEVDAMNFDSEAFDLEAFGLDAFGLEAFSLDASNIQSDEPSSEEKTDGSVGQPPREIVYAAPVWTLDNLIPKPAVVGRAQVGWSGEEMSQRPCGEKKDYWTSVPSRENCKRKPTRPCQDVRDEWMWSCAPCHGEQRKGVQVTEILMIEKSKLYCCSECTRKIGATAGGQDQPLLHIDDCPCVWQMKETWLCNNHRKEAHINFKIRAGRAKEEYLRNNDGRHVCPACMQNIVLLETKAWKCCACEGFVYNT